tara:strand:+ start:169 stop:795 length:627 start_codon:yes stop_codon:yes gene_type:complete
MNAIMSPVGGGGNHIRWLCLLDQTFKIQSITEKNKFDFILNDVYNDNRTWHNWLENEWKWRNTINDILFFEHGIPSVEIEIAKSFDKVLYVSSSGDNCYKHYLKFNSNLNTTNSLKFIKKIDKSNNIYNKQSEKKQKRNFGYDFNLLAIDFNHFYKNSLDTTIIEKINNFFSIQIPFDQATEIHNKWLLLNKKAEKDIISVLKKIYVD